MFNKHKVPFKKMFHATQEQLKSQFGMEMVELPAKENRTLKDRQSKQCVVLMPKM